jgi:hypothetical protein
MGRFALLRLEEGYLSCELVNLLIEGREISLHII